MINHQLARLATLAVAITSVLAYTEARASGFQIKENSVKAQGRAFAGSGVAPGDASVVSNNPAAMARFEGTSFQADVTAIDLGFEFKGSGTDALGRPLTGGDGGDAGDLIPVPAMSFIHKFESTGLSVGAQVSAPFGLRTDYEADWVGRYWADKSDLETIDLTLSAALDVIPERLSIGAGVVYEKADVTLSRYVDFGTLLFSQLPAAQRPFAPSFARPQGADGHVEVAGDDTGLGWIVGVNVHPTDKLAIGLSYRSEIDHEFRGDSVWSVPAPVRATLDGRPQTSALFRDGGLTADLTTPSVTTVSISYQFTDKFMMLADYTETGWRSLQQINIDFENPDPNSVEEFGWDDTRFMSIGGEYAFNDAWTFRAGYAYDETPATLAARTPRLPDEDRKWYAVGASWQATPSLEVNFAYTYIDLDTPSVELVDGQGHHLAGEYDASTNLYGVSAKLAF
ncbi:long-chain fatty acid transport protein [Lysobacter niastensis]|uniref:Long-chain fatty acid transport protein n=1 Tax=Lysobacter niastensis TaxID=380629 RepID=A0ABU1WCD7_9GAMM|nr:porin [Lysobacter niastensis]MDR7135032.1 long-chain fatty acid transport protein [Lysobacter niastensis]